MSKRIKFVPLIELPDGKELRTLEDAGRYIQKLPKTKFNTPQWQFAGRQVVSAINGESLEIFARIAFMRALEGVAPGEHPSAPPRDPSKDHIHEFRNRKKRDPWR